MSEGGAELRADARRNRERIIAAADAVFAERGPDAPMEEIARRAGVGVGTLYRRFPDRDALHIAVMQALLVRLNEVGRAAQAEEPDAWGALERFMREMGRLPTASLITGLRDRVKYALRAGGELAPWRGEWAALLEDMVRAAQREGSLRTDVGSADLAMMIIMLARRIPGLPDDLAERFHGQFLEVILDGLRATPRRPADEAPLRMAELQALVMRAPPPGHGVA